MDVEGTNLNGFQKQELNVDSKESLQKVIDIIGKMTADDEIKKAKLVNKSKAVKKLFKKFQKCKATDPEIAKLKEIFYDDDDWDEEYATMEALIDQFKDEEFLDRNGNPSKKLKQYAAADQATMIVLTNKRDKLAQIFNNKDSMKKVLTFTKSMSGGRVKTNKKKEKFLVIPSSNDDAGKNVPLDKIEEVVNAIAEDTQNVIEEGGIKSNPNEIIEKDSDKEDDETINKKKELAEFFKKKKQDKFKKMFDCIEETDSCLDKLKASVKKLNAGYAKEQDLKNANDSFKKSWQELMNCSFRNVELQIKNFMDACYTGADNKNSCNNEGAYLQIAAIAAALNANIKTLIESINSIYNFIDAFNQQWVNFAKFGPNSRFKINQKIIRPKNKKKHQIPDEQWNKMSFFEKYEKSWKFGDMTQNVPKMWFLNFSKTEKEKFCKDRFKWRQKRLTELAEKLKNKDKGIIESIDKFVFYENRDGYGYWMPTKDFNASVYSSEENTILDSFKKEIEECSQKKLIYNKFRFGDKFLFCNGISSEKRLENFKNNRYGSQVDYNSYFNSNSQSTFTGKKRKNFNNNEYYKDYFAPNAYTYRKKYNRFKKKDQGDGKNFTYEE